MFMIQHYRLQRYKKYINRRALVANICKKSSGSCEPKPKQKRMKKMMTVLADYFFFKYSCTLSAGTISSLNI